MKLFLLFLSIIFCFTANAQIEKGSKLLGGSLNFNYTDYPSATNNPAVTNFNISAEFAKAFKNNNFRGFHIGYGNGNLGNTKTNSYFGGLFYRKYISIVKDFFFFGEADINLAYGKTASNSIGTPATNLTSNIYSSAISLRPGLSYAVNPKLHLEVAFSTLASLYYQHEEVKQTTGSTTNTSKMNSVGISTSTQLNPFSNIQFGFRFLLQKK